MCVVVAAADIDPKMPVWDRPTVTIRVARTLTYGQALHQVRMLLIWLGALQSNDYATCWCGDPVQVPGLTPIVPRQPGMIREEAAGAA